MVAAPNIPILDSSQYLLVKLEASLDCLSLVSPFDLTKSDRFVTLVTFSNPNPFGPSSALGNKLLESIVKINSDS